MTRRALRNFPASVFKQAANFSAKGSSLLGRSEVIARALLAEDRSQVDCYRLIVRDMVGRVLRKSRGIVERDNYNYRLHAFEDLNPHEISELEAIYEQRIASYLEQRADPLFDHAPKRLKLSDGGHKPSRRSLSQKASTHHKSVGYSV